MFLSESTEAHGRQTLPTTTTHHSRWKTLFILQCLLSDSYLCVAQGSAVTITRGPTTGIVTQEIPNLLLTDHRIISQLVYIDLDFEHTLRKHVDLDKVHDVEVLLWYDRHMDRTKDSIKEILSQAEKTIVLKQSPSTRPKRAIGAVVMGVMALLTVVGAVVGGTMTAVNSISVKEVQKKNDELQAAIKDIQRSLATQHETNEHLVKIIRDTIVISTLQSERMEHSVKLHEQATRSRDNFYSFVEPVLYFTNSYLRQLELDMHNLLHAHIPLYFVDVQLVRQALSNLHGPDLDTAQINIAFEAGSAIPMYINVDRMHVSFLLNIPLVKPDRIYQLKKVLNVGTWRGDTRMTINSPKFIAYQNTSTMYLIPQLQNCQVFKDLNYLCPGNPFTPVKGGLCGLEDNSSDSTLCDVTVLRSTDILTEAVLIGNMWLVSTNAPNLTITYTKHGTFTVKPILHSTFTTVIPRDVLISVGSETLFYVNTEGMAGGMELVNTFKPFTVPQDPELDALLDKKQSHSLQLLLQQNNVSIADLQFSTEDHSFISSPEYWSTVAHLTWAGSMTAWVLVITVLILLHNKTLTQIMKVVRERQREIRQQQLLTSVV